jgi:predicted nucleotidyltransferase
LKIFNDNQVEYLIVGGYAVIRYTEPRYTKDIDLWVRADKQNAAAVFKALKDFGAPLSGMSENDFAYEGYFYQVGIPPVRIDILMSITGLKFDEAWNQRVETDFDGVKANFISREDLITAKLAAGRPQEILDAQLLSSSIEEPSKD